MVQAVAVASVKFLDVSAGFPGSILDPHILQLNKPYREVTQGNWLNRRCKQIGLVKLNLCCWELGLSLIKVVNESFQANSYIN